MEKAVAYTTVHRSEGCSREALPAAQEAFDKAVGQSGIDFGPTGALSHNISTVVTVLLR